MGKPIPSKTLCNEFRQRTRIRESPAGAAIGGLSSRNGARPILLISAWMILQYGRLRQREIRIHEAARLPRSSGNTAVYAKSNPVHQIIPMPVRPIRPDRAITVRIRPRTRQLVRSYRQPPDWPRTGSPLRGPTENAGGWPDRFRNVAASGQ